MSSDFNGGQWNSSLRVRTAKPSNMEVPPRSNAEKVDEREEHHWSQPGQYTQHPVLRMRKALEDNEKSIVRTGTRS